MSSPTSYLSNKTYSMVRTTSSVRTPNWKKLKTLPPINNYTKSEVTYREVMGLVKYHIVYSNSTNLIQTFYEGYMAFASDNTEPDVDADDPSQRAIAKLMDEAKFGRTSTLTTMAEAHKTALTVAKTATKLYKAISALKKLHLGDFTNALGVTSTATQTRYFNRTKSQLLRFQKKPNAHVGKYRQRYHQQRLEAFIGDTWLEYSYGWKPLLNDVYNHAEALAAFMTNHGNVVRLIKGRAKTERKSEWSDKVLWDNGVVAYRRFQSLISRRWVEYGVYFKIPEGQLSAANVFGLTNPWVVAWEIVPFSFIADWFIPIGTALESLTAYDGLIFHSGYKSVRDTKTKTRIFRPSGQVGVDGSGRNVDFSGANLQYDYNSLYINRANIFAWPGYGLPKFKDPRSFAHAASALALLDSLFNKNRR